MIFRIFFLIAGVFTAPVFLWSQSAFSKLSFEKALEKAAAESKPLWVQMDSKDCEPCNDVADSGFANLKLVGYIKNNFIAIRPRAGKADWQMLVDTFKAPKLGTIFFDAHKNIIHRTSGSASHFLKYINEGKLAKAKATTQNFRRTEIKKLWADTSLGGKIKKLNLEIEETVAQNLAADSLLEHICSLLPTDSINTKRGVQIIMRGAPVLGTRPDSLARANRDLFNQSWYGMDLQKRVLINGRIINHTTQKAIAAKNETLALRAALFNRNVQDNPETSPKGYYKTLNVYYRGVKDTLKLLRNLSALMNSSYMNQLPEKVKSQDSLKRANPKGFVSYSNIPADTIWDNGKIFMVKAMRTLTAQTKAIAAEMNSAAWDVYKMSDDFYQLREAERLAAHALKFADKADINVTYAGLLYKNG